MLLFQMNVSILNQDVDIFDEVYSLNELIGLFESAYVFFTFFNRLIDLQGYIVGIKITLSMSSFMHIYLLLKVLFTEDSDNR